MHYNPRFDTINYMTERMDDNPRFDTTNYMTETMDYNTRFDAATYRTEKWTTTQFQQKCEGEEQTNLGLVHPKKLAQLQKQEIHKL
jgi:hypothetical protein